MCIVTCHLSAVNGPCACWPVGSRAAVLSYLEYSNLLEFVLKNFSAHEKFSNITFGAKEDEKQKGRSVNTVV